MQPIEQPEAVEFTEAENLAMWGKTEELETVIAKLEKIMTQDRDGTGFRTVAEQRRNLRLLRDDLAAEVARRKKTASPPPIPKGGAE